MNALEARLFMVESRIRNEENSRHEQSENLKREIEYLKHSNLSVTSKVPIALTPAEIGPQFQSRNYNSGKIRTKKKVGRNPKLNRVTELDTALRNNTSQMEMTKIYRDYSPNNYTAGSKHRMGSRPVSSSAIREYKEIMFKTLQIDSTQNLYKRKNNEESKL